MVGVALAGCHDERQLRYDPSATAQYRSRATLYSKLRRSLIQQYPAIQQKFLRHGTRRSAAPCYRPQTSNHLSCRSRSPAADLTFPSALTFLAGLRATSPRLPRAQMRSMRKRPLPAAKAPPGAIINATSSYHSTTASNCFQVQTKKAPA